MTKTTEVTSLFQTIEDDALLNMGVADRCLVRERTVLY